MAATACSVLVRAVTPARGRCCTAAPPARRFLSTLPLRVRGILSSSVHEAGIIQAGRCPRRWSSRDRGVKRVTDDGPSLRMTSSPKRLSREAGGIRKDGRESPASVSAFVHSSRVSSGCSGRNSSSRALSKPCWSPMLRSKGSWKTVSSCMSRRPEGLSRPARYFRLCLMSAASCRTLPARMRS